MNNFKILCIFPTFSFVWYNVTLQVIYNTTWKPKFVCVYTRSFKKFAYSFMYIAIIIQKGIIKYVQMRYCQNFFIFTRYLLNIQRSLYKKLHPIVFGCTFKSFWLPYFSSETLLYWKRYSGQVVCKISHKCSLTATLTKKQELYSYRNTQYDMYSNLVTILN